MLSETRGPWGALSPAIWSPQHVPVMGLPRRGLLRPLTRMGSGTRKNGGGLGDVGGQSGGGGSGFLKYPKRNPFGQAEFIEAVLERRVVLEGKPRSFSTSLGPGDHLAIMEAEATYVSVACLLRGQAPPVLSVSSCSVPCGVDTGHHVGPEEGM